MDGEAPSPHGDLHELAMLHPLLPGPRTVKLRSREQGIGRADVGTTRKLVSKLHLKVVLDDDGAAW